jgi:hypothetical protein
MYIPEWHAGPLVAEFGEDALYFIGQECYTYVCMAWGIGLLVDSGRHFWEKTV